MFHVVPGQGAYEQVCVHFGQYPRPLGLSLSAQVSVPTPSSIRVHHFVEKEGKTATKILDELSKKYRLVIGVYGSGDFRFVEMPIGIDVEIKDGTPADVFDAIADETPTQRECSSNHWLRHGSAV